MLVLLVLLGHKLQEMKHESGRCSISGGVCFNDQFTAGGTFRHLHKTSNDITGTILDILVLDVTLRRYCGLDNSYRDAEKRTALRGRSVISEDLAVMELTFAESSGIYLDLECIAARMEVEVVRYGNPGFSSDKGDTDIVFEFGLVVFGVFRIQFVHEMRLHLGGDVLDLAGFIQFAQIDTTFAASLLNGDLITTIR